MPATFSSLCSAPRTDPDWRASSASTSSPGVWKKRSKTGSTPRRHSGESLEQIVLYYLGLRQATLAVAESCTGGMIAQRITSVPGSSRSFLGGAIVYSDPLKAAFAGVSARPDRAPQAPSPPKWLKRWPTAFACAPAQRWAWASPESPDPPAATETKPVGLVYIALV